MSAFFPTRGVSDPWFRLGRVEVTTTVFTVGLVIASWLVYVIVPTIGASWAYAPGALAGGQVWRLVTWPLANVPSLWGVLTVFFLWYFGSDLEGQLGRRRMAWLLVGIWGSLTAAATIASLLLPQSTGLAGITMVEFALLLVWIAENPTRPFFFGIPAWALGAALVGIQVLSSLALRDLVGLTSLLLGLAFVGIIARRLGLLRWGRPARQRVRRAPAAARTPRSQARREQRRQTDRERLDELLDRINEKGLQNLTPAQRKELMELRERLKKG